MMMMEISCEKNVTSMQQECNSYVSNIIITLQMVEVLTVEGYFVMQLISTASRSHCLLIFPSVCCKAATTSTSTLQIPAE